MSRLAGNSDVDAVREATDLVRLIGEHVSLRPKGREHVGLCPFHDDKNPSFAVVTHKGNAFYKCHSCGAGGDAFDFVMNYHRMQFGEALRFLADRANITLKPRREEASQGDSTSSKRADLRKANAFAATFFQRTLNDSSAGAVARDVVTQRGISDEMVQAFMVGAAPDQWDALTNLVQRRSLPQEIFLAAGLLKPRKEGGGRGGVYDAFRNRLMFPICDELGNPIAFGGRKINSEDEPKYLNSAESALFAKSKTLYGLNRAKRAIIEAKQAIITEGYTDVIACHQAGFCNVVGTLGTALTRDHARLLSRLCETVVLVFDGDEAGQKAADRGLEVFFSEPVDVKICVLPDEFDPDELLKEPNGRERFDAAVKQSIDALEYKINRFRAQLETASGISGRQKRLESFLMELANIGINSMQGVRRSMVLARIAELLDVSIADVESALPKARKPNAPHIAADVEPNPADAADELHTGGVVEVEAPPARRRAELDLLGVLIYQPDVHASPIRTPDNGEASLCDVISAEHFADPCARRIAQSVWDRLSQGRLFTVQQLLSDFTESHVRQLVSSLYFDGQKLCESTKGNVAGGPTTGVDRAVHMFRAAAASLQSHISLEQYHQTVSEYRSCKDAPDRALLAAQSVLQQRRRQGHIASAIGRGVRSQ